MTRFTVAWAAVVTALCGYGVHQYGFTGPLVLTLAQVPVIVAVELALQAVRTRRTVEDEKTQMEARLALETAARAAHECEVLSAKLVALQNRMGPR